MNSARKLFLTFFLIVALFFSGLFFWRSKIKQTPAPLSPAAPYDIDASPTPEAYISEETAPAPLSALPKEVNLAIPFTSQAPHQNWDRPHKEFCEEASALMAASYINSQPIDSPDDADRKMNAIKDFELQRFGFYNDTDAENTATILREHFGIARVAVIPDPAANDIKRALAQGKAVILPLAGRQLGNPYYQNPGPLYHMLIIKGYTQNGNFITNDTGTRRGADYIYKEDIIMNAIHDWNGGDVNTGRKVMIVVS